MDPVDCDDRWDCVGSAVGFVASAMVFAMYSAVEGVAEEVPYSGAVVFAMYFAVEGIKNHN